MPRHGRIKSKTNIYHVMNRGLNKQLLFDDEVDYCTIGTDLNIFYIKKT